jgi:glycosyltransferase involved in cell wall biosynthesis
MKIIKNPEPTVSVCIPVWNGEDFIAIAIESVLQQSYINYEIIIADNASTDETVKIVEGYMQLYPQIQLHINKENIGLVGNFNACLQLAQGKYIKFLCVDDMLVRNCLEKMVRVLDENENVVLVVGGRSIIDSFGSQISSQRYSKSAQLINGHEVINRCYFGTNYIGEPSAVMFRKAILNRVFDKTLNHLMDLEMWFYLLEQGRMASLPDLLSLIRRHKNQMTFQSIKTGELIRDNLSLATIYGTKAYIKNSQFNIFRRKIRIGYRVWLCRESLDEDLKRSYLRNYSYPIVYKIFMEPLGFTVGILQRFRNLYDAIRI